MSFALLAANPSYTFHVGLALLVAEVAIHFLIIHYVPCNVWLHYLDAVLTVSWQTRRSTGARIWMRSPAFSTAPMTILFSRGTLGL